MESGSYLLCLLQTAAGTAQHIDNVTLPEIIDIFITDISDTDNSDAKRFYSLLPLFFLLR